MNLHHSWFGCKDIKEVANFQRLALLKLRETEKGFQRNTASDKVVLMAFEIAREILLNVKYENASVFYCEGLHKMNFAQKCHSECEECKKKGNAKTINNSIHSRRKNRNIRKFKKVLRNGKLKIPHISTFEISYSGE